MEGYQLFVGIDVAAKTFTVTWRDRSTELVKPLTLPQTPKGFHRLQQHLSALNAPPPQILVVLEATGS